MSSVSGYRVKLEVKESNIESLYFVACTWADYLEVRDGENTFLTQTYRFTERPTRSLQI